MIKTSESGKMAKIFSSFDLGSVQISFVGMIGEFAVWAIEDMLTGEIQYIVDDRKGSLRYLFIYFWLSNARHNLLLDGNN